MKTFLIIVIMLAVVFIAGCKTLNGWLDPETNTVLSEEEYIVLTPEEQEPYGPVVYEAVKADIAEGVTAGLQAAEETVIIYKPMIPEPFVSVALLALGFLTTTWQTISKRRVVLTANRIKLGAEITKKTVDTVVKGTEIWKSFKDSQTASAENTNAIMPDAL